MTEKTSPGLEFDLERTHAVAPEPAVRSVPVFETHTIHPIPEEDRHGKGRNLFTIWFAANLSPLAFITGALAPQLFGLGFLWSAVAIIAGTLLGGLLMAFHSAQGAQLGLPQMIQTRGQFGARGSMVILLVVVLMYLGFFTSAGSLGAASLSVAVGGFSANGWLIPVMAASVLVAALGYRYIHVVGTIGTVVCGILLIGSALIIVFGDSAEHVSFLSTKGFAWSGFLAMIAIGALWLIAFAPYVSDYSRYMPRTAAGIRSTFWSTYAGAVFGACLPMLVGVAVALAVKGDTIEGIPTVLGDGYGRLLLFAFAIITVHANAMNLYGGALTILTSVQTFRASWRPVAKARIAVAVLMAAIAATIALGLGDNFMNNYVNFILLLTITLVPWSIINLLDYYVVHRGNYDLDSLMAAGGGIYGNWRWPAMVSYAIGIAVQIPFISSTLYTGPIARHIDGIDLSWVVGSLITAPLYLALVRSAMKPTGARVR